MRFAVSRGSSLLSERVCKIVITSAVRAFLLERNGRRLGFMDENITEFASRQFRVPRRDHKYRFLYFGGIFRIVTNFYDVNITRRLRGKRDRLYFHRKIDKYNEIYINIR